MMLFLSFYFKVSEGIDFKDDLGRVVIMVGVPFPNTEEPWVRLKKIHLRKKNKSDVWIKKHRLQ